MPTTDTDILIIGAGFAGAATAWHLARRGRPRIIIVERESMPGVHSSGRNAAIVRERVDEPELQPLLSEGAAFLRRGELAPFERRGIMLVGQGEEDVARHFSRARGRGLWCADDGTIDIAGLLVSYLAGREVLFDTTVSKWSRENGRLRVDTSRGEMTCNVLVNAAGPWAGQVGDFPLTPTNRHLFVTPPMDWVDPRWPTVWDGAQGLYFRPESGGLMLCCCDETPATPGEYREDPAVLQRLLSNITALQPALGNISIRTSWVGQRVFAPDRKFVIGPDPRDDRVFHVAGLGGHGVTASYAIGRIAAQWIIEGVATGAEHLAPARVINNPHNTGPAAHSSINKQTR